MYSFLLVEKQFSLESQPSAPTKEKRFAYSLYLAMLLLLVKISEKIEKRGGERPLQETRFIKKLLADDKIKSLSLRYKGETFDFDSICDSIAQRVKDSAIYKNYIKARNENPGWTDERIWKDIFDTVIMVSPEVNAVISHRENFTLRGVERMRGIMDETFTNFLISQDNLGEAVKTLRHSLEKARELYIRLLALPIDLTALNEKEMDDRRHRYIVSDEDINPNLRFVENDFVKLLSSDADLLQEIEKFKVAWLQEEPLMSHRLLKAILDSDVYQEYMALPNVDFHDDCEVWRRIFKQVILTNEDFLETLEDKSVFWNDDLDIIGTFVVKTIKRFEENPDTRPLMDQYKDAEDRRFGEELMGYLFKNRETYRGYIEQALENSSWESERLAFMDVVIIETALAEILNFPKIPLSASINEYIEIAKSYSTAKSGVFVNGILGGIVNRLRAEGKLLGK